MILLAIQYREYWGTLSGTTAQLTSMRTVQEHFIDYMVYGVSGKEKIESDLSGTTGAILQAVFGVGTAAIAAATFFNVVNSLEAARKTESATIMTRGKYVFSELIQWLNRDSNYQRIEATVFFREYYNTATGETIRVVYGNSVPGDPRNNYETGAFRVNRIQLKNGTWIQPIAS